MHRNLLLLLLPVAWLSQSLEAQISVSVSAINPITTTATNGSVTVSNSRPIGPVPVALFEQTSQVPGNGSAASVQVAGGTSPTLAWCNAGIACSNTTSNATTSTNTIQLLVTFSAATPTPVRFTYDTSELSLPPGATAPTAMVDVDNNGTIDSINGTPLSFFPPRTIGPQPLVFRVILQGSMTQVGDLITGVDLRVQPDNDLSIQLAAVGCANHGPELLPSFRETGLFVANPSPVSSLKVFVFGLATQPILIPSSTPTPCLLLPRIDAVVVMPSFSSVEIPLPASVRPATLWIQSVELVGNSVLTGFAASATAN